MHTSMLCISQIYMFQYMYMDKGMVMNHHFGKFFMNVILILKITNSSLWLWVYLYDLKKQI
jgi:hypothetical protein